MIAMSRFKWLFMNEKIENRPQLRIILSPLLHPFHVFTKLSRKGRPEHQIPSFWNNASLVSAFHRPFELRFLL